MITNTNVKTIYRDHGVHLEKINEKGERIWPTPTPKEWEEYDLRSYSGAPDGHKTGSTHTGENDSMEGEMNRVFMWKDPEKGVVAPITAFPDQLIPGLSCPDCGEPACRTDQIGVALCTGTPGWFFYYREVTDGIGKPETKLRMVNGQLQEVTEMNPVKIERQPDGEFKEKNNEN